MKGLSLWQPWGLFMFRGWKQNETRSWSTSYRGLLAIQAAKNRTAIEDANSILLEAGFKTVHRKDGTVDRLEECDSTPDATDWHFGELLCIVELVDCVPVEKVRDGLSQRERAMGNYSDGRFAWLTENCRPLKPTIPCKGAQGLFTIQPEVEIKIATQYPNLSCSAAGARRNDLFS